MQLIYAFNGNGKTRLSREFKALVSPKIEIDQEETEDAGLENKKILYYNAFTEDLFYWDNDLKEDAKPKLKYIPMFLQNGFLKIKDKIKMLLNFFNTIQMIN